MVVIENKYNIGDYIYNKTDDERSTYVIICLQISGDEHSITYGCQRNGETTWFYELEIETTQLEYK